MRFSSLAPALVAAVLALSTSARADVCTPLPGNNACAEIVTSLFAAIRSVHDTPASATVDTFKTEFVGRLQGGPILFDQSFAVPFTDPSVPSILASIETVLTGAAPGPLSFLGPTLVSSAQTSSHSQSIAVDSSSSVVYVAPTVDTFGPNTVLQGDQTCTGVLVLTPATPLTPGTGIATGCTGGTVFNILPGQLDIGIATTTVTDVFQTSTDTTTVLTSQTYSLTAEPLLSPVTAPEPASLATLSGALALLGLARRRPQS